MTKIASLPTIAGALLALGLSAAPAEALAGRTFVSGKGTDASAGACQPTAPCRTFAFALTQTTAGGEILVVDSGEYGPVTITNRISIVNDGAGVASNQAGSGTAITINAGANNSVHLRGLTIDNGSAGIQFITGGNLAFENCVIRNVAGFGILISPSTPSRFTVSNTIASSNNDGIFVQPVGSAAVTGVLSKVTTNNNFNNGTVVDGTQTTGTSLNITIIDSEASNNSIAGVAAAASPGHVAVMLRNVVASYNTVGLNADSAAILRVAHSVVTGNRTGLTNNRGSTVFSYGDNDIDGNGNDTADAGRLTPLAMH